MNAGNSSGVNPPLESLPRISGLIGKSGSGL
jgi:hypothetical protein